jgi:hypothetical protein
MDANKSITAIFAPDTADTDSDGLSNFAEVVTYGTNPILADSDGDGFDDGFETNNGFNPTLYTSTPEGIASVRTLPGSVPAAVQFLFYAAKGAVYRIEVSADLTNWSALETAIIGHGTAVIRNFPTEDLPQRFFRSARN